jgi:tetratricopeptide (TPR) repeat protein
MGESRKDIPAANEQVALADLLPATDRNDHGVLSTGRILLDPQPAELNRDSLPRITGYKTLERLGRGGMGVVFKARHLELDRVVAIKMLLAGTHADREDLSRFRLEAEAVARLQHPHVVQIFEIGEQDGQPYYAMEFVDGGHLGSHTSGIPQPATKCARVIKVLAHTLHYAHQRGVVHRDLKPANILLTQDGEPKITDFGLAKRLEAKGMTESGILIGTPSYMAPEQAAGGKRPVGPTADVYSLGAVLYELLTGRPPFRAETSWDTVAQVLADEPVAPSRLQPKVPRDLETICLKCLQKNPEKRYSSAELLAADLSRYLEGEPILARPVGWLERSAKWVRKRPAVAGLLAAVVVVAVAGFAGMYWKMRAEQLARHDADVAQQAATEQRLIAEQALAKAEIETASALAISDFLRNDLLEQASPESQPDRELKLETILDRASENIAGQFDRQPLVEAALRQTIGATYVKLGKFAKGELHLKRAYELRSRELGDDNSETLMSLCDLATVIKYLGRYAEAEPIFLSADSTLRRVLGGEHPQTLMNANNLAELYRAQGRLEEAKWLFIENLRAEQKVLGNEHPSTLITMNNLAEAYTSLGQTKESFDLCSKVLETRLRLLGEEHPHTLSSMNNMAGLQKAMGKLDEAEALYLRTLEIRRRVMGEEHPATMNNINNLASFYSDRERHADAEPLYAKTLEMRRKVLGESHPDTLISQNNLAWCYESLGRMNDAEQLYKQTLETCREKSLPLKFVCINNLAELYRKNKRFAEAEPLYQEGLESLRRSRGDENPTTLRFMNNIGLFYSDSGRHEEAEKLLERVLELRGRRIGPEHPDTLVTMNHLATAHKDQQHYDEAERLYKQALEMRRRVLGRTNRSTATTLNNLVYLYNLQQRYADSEQLLLELWQDYQQPEFETSDSDKSRRKDCAQRLASLYTAWGKTDEAKSWQEKLP